MTIERKICVSLLAAGLASFVGSSQFVRRCGDNVAAVIGYLAAVWISPAVIYGAVVLIEAVCLPWMRLHRLFVTTSVRWLILGLLISYLPVFIYIVCGVLGGG